MNLLYVLGLACLVALAASQSNEDGNSESAPGESGPDESGNSERAPGESGPDESMNSERGPDESGPNESNSERGPNERGPDESGRGNSGRGNGGRGNNGRGNSGRGNNGRGNSGRGNNGRGNSERGPNEHRGGHHGGRHGGHHRRPKFDSTVCIDTSKFVEASSRAAGCENLTMETESTGRERRHPGRGHGHGHGREMRRNMECFANAFNIRNANDETVVANVQNALRAVALEGKGDVLANAYGSCANNTEVLTREQNREVMRCFGRALEENCPRTKETTAMPMPIMD